MKPSLWNYNWAKFLNAILRKMTVKIEVIFIGGRTGNIFVRWPNMFPSLSWNRDTQISQELYYLD
jgi:hypothetical protein